MCLGTNTMVHAMGEHDDMNATPHVQRTGYMEVQPDRRDIPWYRRTVSSGPCIDVSLVIEITVNPIIANNTVNIVQIICNGDTPIALTGSTPIGGNGSYTYLWESSTTGSTTGFSAATGTNTTISFTPPALTTTTWYRRTVTSAPCPAVVSTSVQILVNAVIANNTVSSAQGICSGGGYVT